MLPSRGRQDTTGNTKEGVRRELWPTPQKLIREKDLDGDKDGGILEAVKSKKRPLQRILSRAKAIFRASLVAKSSSAGNLTLREPYYFMNVAVHDYCPHPQQQFGTTERLADFQFTISSFLPNLSELQLPSKSELSSSENGNNGRAVTFSSPQYSLKLNERFYKVRLFESYLFRNVLFIS